MKLALTFQFLLLVLLMGNVCAWSAEHSGKKDEKETEASSSTDSNTNTPPTEEDRLAESLGIEGGATTVKALQAALKAADKDEVTDKKEEDGKDDKKDEKTAQEKANELYSQLAAELGEGEAGEKKLEELLNNANASELFGESLGEMKTVAEARGLPATELNQQIRNLAGSFKPEDIAKRQQFIQERDRRIQSDPLARALSGPGGQRPAAALESAAQFRANPKDAKGFASTVGQMNGATRNNLMADINQAIKDSPDDKTLKAFGSALQSADQYWDARNAGASAAQAKDKLEPGQEEIGDAMEKQFAQNREIDSILSSAVGPNGEVKDQAALDALKERYAGSEDAILDYIQEQQATADNKNLSDAERALAQSRVDKWSRVLEEGDGHLGVKNADGGSGQAGGERFGSGGADFYGEDIGDVVSHLASKGDLENLSLNREGVNKDDSVGDLFGGSSRIELSKNKEGEIQTNNVTGDEKVQAAADIASAAIKRLKESPTLGDAATALGAAGFIALQGQRAIENATGAWEGVPDSVKEAAINSKSGASAVEVQARIRKLAEQGLAFNPETGYFQAPCVGEACGTGGANISAATVASGDPKEWANAQAEVKSAAERTGTVVDIPGFGGYAVKGLERFIATNSPVTEPDVRTAPVAKPVSAFEAGALAYASSARLEQALVHAAEEFSADHTINNTAPSLAGKVGYGDVGAAFSVDNMEDYKQLVNAQKLQGRPTFVVPTKIGECQNCDISATHRIKNASEYKNSSFIYLNVDTSGGREVANGTGAQRYSGSSWVSGNNGAIWYVNPRTNQLQMRFNP